MTGRVVWLVAGLIALGGCGDDDECAGASCEDSLPLDLGGGDAGGGDAGGGDAGSGGDAFTPPSDLGPPGGGCGREPGSTDGRVDHEGRTRTFLVHLPSGYDRDTPAPVVLNFHGRGSNAGQQAALSGMNAKADAEGFIAVHPQGVGATWNADFCCGEAMSSDVDDVGFVAAMLDELSRRFCIDPSRVYATGFSNGGFISHRLACELADRITAIAPVAGTNVTSPCEPSRPVPMFHFHGTEDTLVPYDGFAGGFASVASTTGDWAGRNGCGATSATYFTSGDVTCEEWTGCDADATVRLCTVDGGGHQWPGGFTVPGLGANTDAIVATDAMWDFFTAHTL